MKRVAVAAVLVAASCGTSTVPEPQHVVWSDMPKHNVPRSQDTPESFIVPPPRAAKKKVSRSRVTSPARNSTPSTGGALPPRSVLMCESGGNYQAENPTSSASGGWQIVDGTWGGYGGYRHASDAPPEVQDERAAQLWAGGSGASHWRACL